jgi:type II secretory pathway component GspD/PulD (secretin)
MPALPLTQLDERGPAADLDNRTFTLTFAQPVPVRDLLLLLVRGTNLSLVPDPALTGSFIGELKSVTVRKALEAILPPLGLDYRVEDGFIYVFTRERDTRFYDINYIATQRTASSTLGGRAVDPAAISSASVSTATSTDVFADLTKGVQALVSDRGAFNLDRKAGLLQVTDFPDRLDRIGDYLDAVEGRVQRQVELDARIVEVELKDAAASGVDWGLVAAGMGGGPASATAAPGRRFLTRLKVADLSRLMVVLGEQGTVATLQTNRMATLNNEPAIVRSEAMTLSVTPQIAPDGVVMLSLTPMVKTPMIAESDTLARVADGETLVVSGFTRSREVRERTNAGIGGGWFGRRTVVTQKRVELLILLTPRIL